MQPKKPHLPMSPEVGQNRENLTRQRLLPHR